MNMRITLFTFLFLVVCGVICEPVRNTNCVPSNTNCVPSNTNCVPSNVSHNDDDNNDNSSPEETDELFETLKVTEIVREKRQENNSRRSTPPGTRGNQNQDVNSFSTDNNFGETTPSTARNQNNDNTNSDSINQDWLKTLLLNENSFTLPTTINEENQQTTTPRIDSRNQRTTSNLRNNTTPRSNLRNPTSTTPRSNSRNETTTPRNDRLTTRRNNLRNQTTTTTRNNPSETSTTRLTTSRPTTRSAFRNEASTTSTPRTNDQQNETLDRDESYVEYETTPDSILGRRNNNENRTSRNPDENRTSRNPDENRTSRNPDENRTSRNPNENRTTRNPNENRTTRNPNENRTTRSPNENRSRNTDENRTTRNRNENRTSRNPDADSTTRNPNQERISRNQNESSTRSPEEIEDNIKRVDETSNVTGNKTLNKIEEIVGIQEDEKRNTPELIRSRGFQYEEHKVPTQDGYILTIFRIVNPFRRTPNMKVVFLQHGIGRSSDDFLINSEGELDPNTHRYSENGGTLINNCDPRGNKTAANTLGFVLADCGYDVWLGNSRGNSYSHEHQTLNSNNSDDDYWKYSFQQMGQYDIPAVIDHILNQTNKDSLAIIGHSQGTTQTFAMLSSDPAHARKVNTFVALAPVVYFDDFNPFDFQPALIRAVITNDFVKNAAELVQRRSRSNVGPSDSQEGDFTSLISSAICNVVKQVTSCGNYVSGSASIHNNKTRENVYARHGNRASSWCIAHYAQQIASRRFERFQNDSEIPREYSLDKVDSSKIALFYGDKDILTNEKQMERLKNNLQSNNRRLLDDYPIPCKEWTHLDFTKAKNTGECMNGRILKLLSRNKRSALRRRHIIIRVIEPEYIRVPIYYYRY